MIEIMNKEALQRLAMVRGEPEMLELYQDITEAHTRHDTASISVNEYFGNGLVRRSDRGYLYGDVRGV